MYEQPRIEPLAKSRGIYLLRDSRGNLLGVGSPDVLGLLLTKSKRCARPNVVVGFPNRNKHEQVRIQ